MTFCLLVFFFTPFLCNFCWELWNLCNGVVSLPVEFYIAGVSAGLDSDTTIL